MDVSDRLVQLTQRDAAAEQPLGQPLADPDPEPPCQASSLGPTCVPGERMGPDPPCLLPARDPVAPDRTHRACYPPGTHEPGSDPPCLVTEWGPSTPDPPLSQVDGARATYRRWHVGQNVVPRPPRKTLRNGVEQRGQGRPDWP
jgi:hypothetical protein